MFSACVLSGLLLGTSEILEPAQQNRPFPTGQLIENVHSESAGGQRFAIYLPRGFDPATPTPVLYLMDPRGRARVPARLFQDAAERYGYILVSSHNTTSDGPMEPNLHAMQAMWDDSHAWFTIDSRRTYVAGFSGTARTASLMAQNRPAFTGIIGVGAGFHLTVKPSADMPFLYYGTFGATDYNFHELQVLEQTLTDLDVPHRMSIFPGPHAWMPADIALRAVEWMELRAMQAGARTVDPARLQEWWARDQQSARDKLQEGRALEAAWRFAAIARDYEGLRDVAAVKQTAQAIALSAAARTQLKRRQAETRAWYEWADSRMQAIARAFPVGERAPAMTPQELAHEIGLAALKRAATRDDSDAALEARRRLNQFEVQFGFYLPFDALAVSEFTRAQYYLTLALEIDDRSPVTWYLKAQVAARLREDADALASLKRAVESGFRDLAFLDADAAFARLRPRPEFGSIIEILKREGDARDTLTVDRPPVSLLQLQSF